MSVEAQLSSLRQWAEVNGHSVIGEYLDLGISARKSPSKRPALNRLLENLKEIDIIAFTKLDRWTRNIKGYYTVQEQLDKAKVSWVAIQEDYETVTASGRFKVNIMLAVAENEADRTGERVKTIIEHKVAKGEHVGKKPPLGYSIVNKHLVPNEEAPIAQGAYRTFLSTGSLASTRDYLHSHGYNYIYNSIKKILTNTIYKGYFHGNESYCEPIISAQDFETVQGLLKKRSVRGNQEERVYLFSGLMRCSECGKIIVGTYRPRCREGNRYQYRCNGYYQDKRCNNNTYIPEWEIEDLLLGRIESEIKSMSTTITQKKKSKPVDNSKKLERLTELYVDGLISKEEYQSRRDALSIPTTTPPQSPLKKINLSGSVREVYQDMTRQEKRVFWRSVIESIEIDGKSVTCTFK